MTWLGTVGGITVERTGGVRRSHQRADGRPPKGVLHTTEGGWDGSLGVFRRTGTPTFMLGRDARGRLRIAQFMPIGEMALTLKNDSGGIETNRDCLVQIEIVDFSKRTRWLPEPETTRLLASLLHRLSLADVGIPLRRGGDGTRNAQRWRTQAGWFGHSELPENDHWDPGALDWRELLRLAGGARPEEDEMITPEFKTWVEQRLVHGKAVAPANGDWWPDAEWIHRIIALYGPHLLFRQWSDWYRFDRNPATRPDKLPGKVGPGYWQGLAWLLEHSARADDVIEAELARKVREVAALTEKVADLEAQLAGALARHDGNADAVTELQAQLSAVEDLLRQALAALEA